MNQVFEIQQSPTYSNTVTNTESNYDQDGQYIHSFYNLISIIESTDIVKQINEITTMYSTIMAQMIIEARSININYKKMSLY